MSAGTAFAIAVAAFAAGLSFGYLVGTAHARRALEQANAALSGLVAEMERRAERRRRDRHPLPDSAADEFSAQDTYNPSEDGTRELAAHARELGVVLDKRAHKENA